MININIMSASYAKTALWASDDDDGQPLDNEFNISDITTFTAYQMYLDCAAFVIKAGNLLDDISSEDAGHDFWLTRNRHGVGFWDRGIGEVGDKLTKLAHSFSEVTLLVTANGELVL